MLTRAKHNLIPLLLIASLHVWSWSNAEIFTAISDLEPLLKTHKRIIDDIDFYIMKQEERLHTVKRYLKIYMHEHEKAMADIPDYVGNPINAFTLIKRLTIDLDFIADTVKVSTEYIKNITMKHEDSNYPMLEDLTGAAQALTRLQETYRLNVHELSEGMLNGDASSTPMSASDCYELGRALYNEKDFTNALAWMTEAYRKFKEHDQAYPFKEIEILEYIAFSHDSLADKRRALEGIQKILKLDPNHARALEILPNFEKELAEVQNKEQQGDVGVPRQDHKAQEEWIPPPEGEWQYYHEREMHNYAALCRGEMDVAPEISKRLKCRYTSEHHPFLKYAPFKVEQRYIKPDIFVFHDVLSDTEIETIQSLAKLRFTRALVIDQQSGKGIAAKDRISKLSWVRDDVSPVVARVSQRVADMTGLDLETAEDLQVVNYGIGGQYEAHFDFARKNAGYQLAGSRLATVLFYMTDVAHGGATVFTELGLSLFPIKGSAAFWMNLHPSGEGDIASRHAACPVLKGSKWVCNKWIHLQGQEFIRPCNLEYQDEGINRKLPRPVLRKSS